MKILYVVFEALLGGHVLSAVTIAREMKNYGVEPVFAGKKGLLTTEIQKDMIFESVDIPVFHGSRQTYFTWDSIAAVKQLRDVVRDHHIDIIHAFDARSYMHAYLAGMQENIPVLCTLCGGTDPYYNLPLASKIIVFSEEQKSKMVKTYNWPAENTDVIRTRLDMRKILADEYRLSDGESEQYGMDLSVPRIMMISSFDGTKIKSIHQVLDAVEVLFSRGVIFQLVMIGGQGEYHSEAVLRGQQICGEENKNKIVFTGPVLNAFRLLQRADIVLGVGRSAFEGMIYSKPTLIVGANGYAGTVSEETVEQIGWFNFSGRNQANVLPMENLVRAIEVLLENKDQARELGCFCHEFIKAEIDVRVGAPKLLKIYGKMLNAEAEPSLLERRISFAKCLFPIVFDNEVHTVKRKIKSLFLGTK